MAAEEKRTTTNLTAVIPVGFLSRNKRHTDADGRDRRTRRLSSLLARRTPPPPLPPRRSQGCLLSFTGSKRPRPPPIARSGATRPSNEATKRKAEKCQRHRVAATTKSASRGCGEPGPRSELRRNNPASRRALNGRASNMWYVGGRKKCS